MNRYSKACPHHPCLPKTNWTIKAGLFCVVKSIIYLACLLLRWLRSVSTQTIPIISLFTRNWWLKKNYYKLLCLVSYLVMTLYHIIVCFHTQLKPNCMVIPIISLFLCNVTPYSLWWDVLHVSLRFSRWSGQHVISPRLKLSLSGALNSKVLLTGRFGTITWLLPSAGECEVALLKYSRLQWPSTAYAIYTYTYSIYSMQQ